MKHKNLWAPWRMQYLLSLKDDMESGAGGQEAGPGADIEADECCFLLEYWDHPEHDTQHYIVLRNEHGIALLNRYPYSNGHLLVALGEGRPRLLDYEPAQRQALWNLVERATDLMERALNPQGINTGINQGRAAGAGIPGHLHVHLVPRWSGDTNFITIVGEVRVVPDSLDAMYARYIAVANAV